MTMSPTLDQVERPPFGQIGLSDIGDNAISFDNSVIYTPKILPENLSKMLDNDGEVGSLWRILTTPLRGSQLDVKPKNDRSKSEARFIEEMLFNSYRDGGMIINIRTVIATILRMLIDGWSPHEVVYDIREEQVRVQKIEYRPIRTMEVVLDDDRNISHYLQNVSLLNPNTIRQNPSGKVVISPTKIMHFIHGPEHNYVFGRSIFTNAYYHYEKKHKLYYIAHLAAQINALRLRVLKVPTEHAEREQELLNLVGKLGFNTSISLPSGVELELLDTGDNYVDLLPLIQHHDSQMAKSVLSQVINVGVEGTTGSFNLSDTHFDIFIENLGLIGDHIAEVFNDVLIPRLIDWNFGTRNYPTLQFRPFDRQVRKQLQELFRSISTATALNATPKFLLEVEKAVADTLGLDVEYEDGESADMSLYQQKVLPPEPTAGGGSDNRNRSTRQQRSQSQRTGSSNTSNSNSRRS